MGIPQYDFAPSPPSSEPSSPPTQSIPYGEQDLPEPLSEQESALLDQSLSLLDQDYDLQKPLIHHYFHPRQSSIYIPNSKRSPFDADDTRNHLETSEFAVYGNRTGSSLPSPRIYTGMDYGARMEEGYPSSKPSSYAYRYSQYRRPLIDLVHNKWRTAAASPDFSPSSPAAPSFSQIVSAPKFRRYLMIFLLVLLTLWTSWRWYGKPLWEDHKVWNNALDNQLGRGAAWYGLNMRPAFRDMIQLQTWDRSSLGQTGGKKRLIFIGDIHGCYDERINYSNRTDHLISTGDLISKGPASPAVVDFALAQHMSCVRGNHEDRIILAYRDLNSHLLALPGPDEDQDDSSPRAPSPRGPLVDSLDDESFSHGDYIDRKFAKALTKEQASYLASCPTVLDLGHVPGVGRTVVAHAGLVPGIGLEDQDPMGIMSMKSIDLKTHVPSRDPKGTPWFKLWNAYQSLLPEQDRSTVIYGHDAKRGLQVEKYTKGLDSGCVEGRKLTALVVTIESDQNSKQETVSVRCKDHRGLKGKDKGWEDLPFMRIKDDEYGGAHY
ncbi:MAG: hypothetical protein Q9200_000602 [Gallowayella weberi]